MRWPWGGDLDERGAWSRFKSRTIRDAAVTTAAAGGHVHVAARDGRWCVERTGIGVLWVPIADPPRGFSSAEVFYDEGFR